MSMSGYNTEHMLGVALKLVTREQGNQRDKLGKPYMLHLFTVTSNALRIVVEDNIDLYAYNTNTDELMILTLLHDLLEDTSITIENLIELGFPKDGNIINSLKMITRPPKESGISYYDYVRRIRDSNLILVKIAKKADLQHNMQKDRVEALSLLDPIKSDKLQKRYIKALSILNHELI